MADDMLKLAEVENLVARATDEALDGPEWALNMALCDYANAYQSICDDIVRLLQRQLQSGNPKVTFLALVLTETVVKNGPALIYSSVASRCFLHQVAILSNGSLGVDVQHQALILIRQWADAFQSGAFYDIYQQLQVQGVVFPELENNAPVFTPPSSTTSLKEEMALKPKRHSREQQLQKLHADLKVVQQKIKILRDLYASTQDEKELDDVVDFLRQCQPRMNTLIEGGIMGKVDEYTLEECLNVREDILWQFVM
ncbi:hypothetical protein CCR75_001605 [Bremia lactucae]|uniref:VHS domain-containing protein n=1 Tax=Bremia lactucae TaxID=4779 RepID=A0A976FHD5_BRELC|nr:hypothetical protein CCR75_001605 [Bremia lactucae]